MREDRTTAARRGARLPTHGRRNPLPGTAKELEALFFNTPTAGPALQGSAPVSDISSANDVPPAIGLFYDPLAVVPIAPVSGQQSPTLTRSASDQS